MHAKAVKALVALCNLAFFYSCDRREFDFGVIVCRRKSLAVWTKERPFVGPGSDDFKANPIALPEV